jgi:hypothetical protein
MVGVRQTRTQALTSLAHHVGAGRVDVLGGLAQPGGAVLAAPADEVGEGDEELQGHPDEPSDHAPGSSWGSGQGRAWD